jgi:carbonic anhydrase/acetyltransferase-like protein (isoleucine patch superfamily)
LGSGPLVAQVASAWAARDCASSVECREARQHADFSFDAEMLAALPVGADVFVAFDRRFLNWKRDELMGLVRSRGLRLSTIVSASATVAASVTLGVNVFVGDGASVGAGTTLGEGAVIGARVVIGGAARLGRISWLEPGVIVGAEAVIGDRTALGLGVTIADGVAIGEDCVIDVPGVYRHNVPPRTFHNPLFDEPIRIVRP